MRAFLSLYILVVGTTLATPLVSAAQTAPNASAGVVSAQVTPSEEADTPEPGPEYTQGEIIYLESGKRAPWTGLLIEQPDLVRWRLEIDNLRFRLKTDVQLESSKCDVKLDFERQRFSIAQDGFRLKEELYQARMDELAADVVALKKDVAEARDRSFFEQPIFWFVAGIGSAVAIGLVF